MRVIARSWKLSHNFSFLIFHFPEDFRFGILDVYLFQTQGERRKSSHPDLKLSNFA